MGLNEVLMSAATAMQFVVFGDTHHGYVPVFPVTENIDTLTEAGQEYLFVEQHYSLQPHLEAYASNEITRDEFRDITAQYNENRDFWGHTDYADMMMEAIDSGLRVVAFDTRTPEKLGINTLFERPPSETPDYPSDLLQFMTSAYDHQQDMSFDQRSAELVSSIAGSDRASVWIGNGHIHGGHQHGDRQGDFDGYLGEKRTARVTMYANAEHYQMYLTDDLYGNVELECQEEDQPDFMTFAAESEGIATASALTKDFNTSPLQVLDIPSPCYIPNKPLDITPHEP